jgi:prophage regulatory protein
MHEAPFRFLDFPEVSETVKLSRTPIRNRIKAGTFPAPVALSSRCVRWRSTDIAAWLEAQGDTTQEQRSAKGTKARDTRMAKGAK